MGDIPMLDKTNPDNMSSSSIPDNLIRRFSPGPARLTLFSSMNIASTFTDACKRQVKTRNVKIKPDIYLLSTISI